MAWDDEKDTFRQRSDVPADEKLTAAEWNAHVTDQQNRTTPEEVEDTVAALLDGGTNVTISYDDVNGVLTIDASGSGLSEEEVEDVVAALVTAGNAVSVNYDDANDTLTIGVDESSLSFYDGTNLTADVDNQSVSTDEAVIDGSRLYIQDSEPSSADDGDIWIDTS